MVECFRSRMRLLNEMPEMNRKITPALVLERNNLNLSVRSLDGI